MRKFSIPAYLLGAILVASSPLHGQAQPAVPPQASAGFTVPELSDEQLDQWVKKLNAYTTLLNSSMSALSSWERYKSWVDIKAGPTGKERIVYGLYSMSDSVAKTDVPKALAAVDQEPKIPALDDGATTLANALNNLDPVLKEAYAYYNRKDYTDDKFVKGRELHPKLVEAFQAVETSRAVLKAQYKSIKDQVDIQSLNQIEKTEGKKYRWQAKRVLMEAQKAVESLQKVDSKKDLPAFSEAIKVYADAVRQFDDYIASADGKDKPMGISLKSEPASLLSDLREAREYMEKNNGTWFNNKARSAVSTYNRMVSFSRF